MGRRDGFTIIEVMLFLGISGILFAALMVGVGTNLTQQRYNNNAVDIQSFIRDQYVNTMNVNNGRDKEWHCENSAISQASVTDNPRGTTDCIILGRIISVVDGGSRLIAGDVIGQEPSGTETSLNDITSIMSYNPVASDFYHKEYSLDVDSRLEATNKQASNAVIAILRSPASGLLNVFISEGSLATTKISDMINNSQKGAVLTNCIAGNAGLQPIKSINIDTNISGVNGVSLKSGDGKC